MTKENNSICENQKEINTVEFKGIEKMINPIPRLTEMIESCSIINTTPYIETMNSIINLQTRINVMMSPMIEQLANFNEKQNRIIQNVNRITNIYNEFYASALETMRNIFRNIDFDKLKIQVYKEFLEENREFIDRLINETIFPPIDYLMMKEICENRVTGDLYDLIYSQELKEFYLEKIEKWKNKYDDEAVKKMIDDIKTSFQSNSYYSVYFLVTPLIERMLRENNFDKSDNVPYSKIKKVLKNEVFDVVGEDKMYKIFIEDNLYCNTNKASEFSRHVVHGSNLNMITPKTTMNVLFIYDFIQDMLI